MIYGICTVGGYDADLGEYAGSDRLGTGYRQGDILFNMECCKILWLRNNEPHGTGYIEL